MSSELVPNTDVPSVSAAPWDMEIIPAPTLLLTWTPLTKNGPTTSELLDLVSQELKQG